MTTATEKSALSRYYNAIDSGDFNGCADLFASDGVYIRPDGATGRIVTLEGRENIRDYLRARGNPPHKHQVVLAANEGSSAFVEGEVVGGGKALAFLAHGSFNADGLISRYIALTLPPLAGRRRPSAPEADGRRYRHTIRSPII